MAHRQPREVTQRQKTVTVGRGVIRWGWTDRRLRLVRQVARQGKSMNRQVASQADTQRDRQAGR